MAREESAAFLKKKPVVFSGHSPLALEYVPSSSGTSPKHPLNHVTMVSEKLNPFVQAAEVNPSTFVN